MTSHPYGTPDTFVINAWRTGGRFPPRRELSPGIVIPKLPGVGTTWYERGFLYRMRRVGASAMLALCLVVYSIMVEAVLYDASRPGTRTYWALAAGEIVFTVVTCPLWFRHLWKTGVSGRALRNDLSPRARLAGVLIGMLGVILMPIGVMLTTGAMVAIFLISLLPVPPVEQYARREMARQLWYAQHHPAPADDGTTADA